MSLRGNFGGLHARPPLPGKGGKGKGGKGAAAPWKPGAAAASLGEGPALGPTAARPTLPPGQGKSKAAKAKKRKREQAGGPGPRAVGRLTGAIGPPALVWRGPPREQLEAWTRAGDVASVAHAVHAAKASAPLDHAALLAVLLALPQDLRSNAALRLLRVRALCPDSYAF